MCEPGVPMTVGKARYLFDEVSILPSGVSRVVVFGINRGVFTLAEAINKSFLPDRMAIKHLHISWTKAGGEVKGLHIPVGILTNVQGPESWWMLIDWKRVNGGVCLRDIQTTHGFCVLVIRDTVVGEEMIRMRCLYES